MSTMTVAALAPRVRPMPRPAVKAPVVLPVPAPAVLPAPVPAVVAPPAVAPPAVVPAPAAAGTAAVTVPDRALATLAHLSGLVAGAAGPYLVGRLVKRASPYVRAQAAEAVRFQLGVLVVQVGLLPLMVLSMGFAVLLAVPLALGWVLIVASAGSATASGEKYRYPVRIAPIRIRL